MAALMPQGKQQYFTAGGIPLVGGKVYTYAAGTTTPLATYTTSAGTPGTENTNPVILDSRGEASIFFSNANYKIVVKDSLDSTIWTQDDLAGDAAAAVLTRLALSTGSSLVGHIASGTGAVATTVQEKLRESVSVKDFGAVGDGVTVDTTAVTAAFVDAASTGGNVLVSSTSLLANGRKIYPGLIEVNNHDYATIGTDEKVSNPTFATSASGWTLSGFTASSGPDKISHSTGSSGTATIAGVSLEPFCIYVLGVDISSTTTSGCVDIELNGISLFPGAYVNSTNTGTVNGYWYDSAAVATYGTGLNGVGAASGWPNTSATRWNFSYFHTGAASTANLGVVTDDRWAGSITGVSLIKVSQEAQFASSSITQAEGAAGTYTQPVGWKNYNVGSGCMVFGDRTTGALIPVTPGVAPYAGAFNSIFGYQASTAQINGVENVFMGSFAGQLVDGSANTGIGYSALKYAAKSMENTAVGYKSQYVNARGIANTSMGNESMYESYSGNYNTAIGWAALRLAKSASNNTAVGAAAGVSNGGGVSCTFVGHRSGPWYGDIGTGTTGYAYQTAIGAQAFTFGNGSTAIGYGAAVGSSGVPYTYSTAVGYGAYVTSDTAVAVGSSATASGTGGTSVGNIAQASAGGSSLGRDAKAYGTNTVAVGFSSNAQASGSVSVGYASGIGPTGVNNTFVGASAGSTGGSPAYTNASAFGYNALPTASNQITFGDPNVTVLRAAVTTITAISDERDKANIKPLEVPDAFIDEVLIASWDWNIRTLTGQDQSTKNGSPDLGVIAQQLQALQKKYGVEWLGLVDESNPERLEATPGKLLYPLVQKVQRQSALIASMEARLTALER